MGVARGLSHEMHPPPPLCFTPKAPVVYGANKFSRNRIKWAHVSIDYMNDIIPFSSQTLLCSTEAK